MSASDALLIFLDTRGEFEGWLRLSGGAVAARGGGLQDLPGLVDEGTRASLAVAAIVPGEAVSVHWLEVPAGLSPAQAAAAARLLAADVSAQPVGDMHVAVGPETEDDTTRAVALVSAITMAGWLGRLQAAGLDPDLVLPEPLLLPRPDQGYVRYDRGALPVFRGRSDAFSVEPDLAGLIVGGSAIHTIDGEGFEAGLAEAVANPPVNLRQSVFAKRRRWGVDWKTIRRLAMLGLAILLVTLAIQVVSILRYTYAADALEAEAERIAGGALGRGVQVSNAPAQLRERLTQLGGGSAGYGRIASAVFAAVRDTPNVELSGLIYDVDGTLRATIMADSPATISALQERVRSAGFTAEVGPLRAGGGRPTAELTVRTQ